jgi:hypothetical protein
MMPLVIQRSYVDFIEKRVLVQALLGTICAVLSEQMRQGDECK